MRASSRRLLSPVFAHTIAQAGRRGASGPVAWMQSSDEHNECLITAIM